NCKFCDKEFTSRNRHRAHIRRHLSKDSGRYTCRVCEKTFVQKSSLTTHVRIHSGERPYNCSTCDLKFSDRKFSQSGNMHRHMKSIHKGYLHN
ncbi:zinc finger protein-like protein, partial [Leptotrombidium deliense]